MSRIARIVLIVAAATFAFCAAANYADAADKPAPQAPTKPPKAPAAPSLPPKAPDMTKVATCRDGKAYYHVTGEKRGACSGHGGVAAWADGSPVRSAAGKTAYR